MEVSRTCPCSSNLEAGRLSRERGAVRALGVRQLLRRTEFPERSSDPGPWIGGPDGVGPVHHHVAQVPVEEPDDPVREVPDQGGIAGLALPQRALGLLAGADVHGRGDPHQHGPVGVLHRPDMHLPLEPPDLDLQVRRLATQRGAEGRFELHPFLRGVDLLQGPPDQGSVRPAHRQSRTVDQDVAQVVVEERHDAVREVLRHGMVEQVAPAKLQGRAPLLGEVAHDAVQVARAADLEAARADLDGERGPVAPDVLGLEADSGLGRGLRDLALDQRFRGGCPQVPDVEALDLLAGVPVGLEGPVVRLHDRAAGLENQLDLVDSAREAPEPRLVERPLPPVGCIAAHEQDEDDEAGERERPGREGAPEREANGLHERPGSLVVEAILLLDHRMLNVSDPAPGLVPFPKDRDDVLAHVLSGVPARQDACLERHQGLQAPAPAGPRAPAARGCPG